MKLFRIALFILLVFIVAEPAFAKDVDCMNKQFSIEIKDTTDVKAKSISNSPTIATVKKGQRVSVLKRANQLYQVCYKQTAGYVPIKSASEIFSEEDTAILSKVDEESDGKQLLAAIGKNSKATKVQLHAYEKLHGEWRRALTEMKGVAGYNGIAKKKNEGDGKSPLGLYALGSAFGSASKPSGLKIPYRKTTKYDYWVDDPESMNYNKWVYYRGNPKKKWNSFERMNHELYKYGIVIEYNMNPIIKGRGSAIFLHVWRSANHPTAGCIATSERNMKKILRWLDSSLQPHILITTETDLKKHKLKKF